MSAPQGSTLQDLPEPRVASIVIYPAAGQQDSDHRYLSALAAYSKSLLSNLSENARRCHIVLSNIKADRASLHCDGALRVHECWRKGSPLYWWQIVAALRKYRSIRLVHLQHEFNQFGPIYTVPFIPVLMGLVRVVLRRKVAITFHEVFSPSRFTQSFLNKSGIPFPAFLARGLIVAYYKTVAACADMIFVQDEVFLDVLRGMRIRQPIRILRIGTEQQVATMDRTVARRQLGYQPNERVLLFYGTLDWRKGLDLLLDVLNTLPDNHIRLAIAGGQPVRIRHTRKYQAWHAALQARAEAMAPRVAWHGFVSSEQLTCLMAAADLIVLPYVVPQRVSAVLNIAASYEKPCIASEYLAGQAEPVMLFPVTAQGLRDKIEWALEHLDVLHQAAIDFKAKNDWRLTGAVLEESYLALLAQAGQSPWEKN